MFRTFFSILLVTISCHLMAQTTPSDLLATNIETYRQELLQKDSFQYQRLNELIDSFRLSSLTEEEVDYYLYQIFYLVQHHLFSYRKMRRFVPKQLESLAFVSHFSDEDFQTIEASTPLLDLIHFELLSDEYPFEQKIDSFLLKELAFYDIQANDKVAEVGTGEGVFSLAMAFAYPDIQLFVNEIGNEKVNYLQSKFSNCAVANVADRINIIKGKRKSAGLENLQLDRIIIRNTFHHFSRPTDMLSSIKTAIQPQGQVFLLENTTEDDGPETTLSCDERISQIQIIQTFEANGFQLLRTQVLEDCLLLEFALD